MSTQRTLTACVAGVFLVAGSAGAADWPQWRGPFFNGSTTESDLPAKFSQTENVAWTADLPGAGGSTPIVQGDNVFISAGHPRTRALYALCLNRADGKLRWQREMGVGFSRRGNTGASPSPIADGDRVFFYYGTGTLAAFDLDGQPLWKREVAKDHGAFELMWGYGASALLYKGKLYVPVLHGDHRSRNPPESYMLCIDPKTGKDVWKHVRRTDARGESRQAYTTPIPLEGSKGASILLVGGDYLTAHDPASGKETWRSEDYNPRKNRWWRTVPSAVVVGGVIVNCPPTGEPGLPPKGGRMFAVRIGPSKQLGPKKPAWIVTRNCPDVCTPLAYAGKLFVLDGGAKVMVCMDPDTGKVHWRGRLRGRGKFEASPTGADGKVYCMNHDGQVVVLSAGDKFEVLHRAEMGGRGCRSTIAVAGGQLFIRTSEKLYCVGKKR